MQALRKAFNVHGVYSRRRSARASRRTTAGSSLPNGGRHLAIGPEEPFPKKSLSETVEGRPRPCRHGRHTTQDR
jgi:hypothetical protein